MMNKTREFNEADFALAQTAIETISRQGRRFDPVALASELGLSASELSDLFKRYLGLSPKRLYQFLHEQEAVKLLQQGNSVLSTSLALQLSSPSRVHDLMIATDAMPPAAIARLGEGLVIQWGLAETPLGLALLAQTPHGLCRLEFGARAQLLSAGFARLKAQWGGASFTRNDDAQQRLSEQIWRGERAPLHVRGTNFQIQVWQALLRIPSGQLASYGAIAASLGKPQANRAVGTAVGSNPVSVLIPCHRVLRESGLLGGYAWGLPRKMQLLTNELSLSD